jgi:Initiator Replication protein.
MANRLSLLTNEPVIISVPLKQITRKDNLGDVIAACKSFMKMVVTYRQLSQDGKKMLIKLSHLVDNVVIPAEEKTIRMKKGNLEKTIRVHGNAVFYLSPAQVEFFTKIDYDLARNHPKNFTKYLKYIALNAHTKYTAKFYKLISSYKIKGGFEITVEELKMILGVRYIAEDERAKKEYWKDEYPLFGNFRQRVLEPVKKELYQKADCWFEYRVSGKKSRAVYQLQFKIITPEISNREHHLQQQIRHYLISYFEFSDRDFKSIRTVIENPSIAKADAIAKIIEIKLYIDRNRQAILNKKAFLVKSLLNEFKG